MDTIDFSEIRYDPRDDSKNTMALFEDFDPIYPSPTRMPPP
jgi:hypothetical protein